MGLKEAGHRREGAQGQRTKGITTSRMGDLTDTKINVVWLKDIWPAVRCVRCWPSSLALSFCFGGAKFSLSLFLFYAARQSPSRQKRRATGQTGLSLVVGVSIVRLCACAPCHHSTGWQRIHLQSPYLCMLHRYLYPSHAPSSVRQLPVARLSGIDMPANGRRRRYPFSYSSVRLVVVVLFFSLVRWSITRSHFRWMGAWRVRASAACVDWIVKWFSLDGRSRHQRRLVTSLSLSFRPPLNELAQSTCCTGRNENTRE